MNFTLKYLVFQFHHSHSIEEEFSGSRSSIFKNHSHTPLPWVAKSRSFSAIGPSFWNHLQLIFLSYPSIYVLICPFYVLISS